MGDFFSPLLLVDPGKSFGALGMFLGELEMGEEEETFVLLIQSTRTPW